MGKYLNNYEAAKILAVCYKTLKSLDLKKIKIGKKWKYDSDSVQDYLNEKGKGRAK